ncbi:MAG: hypothetical protein WBM14_15640 [Terracidiphilus sp.]
MERKRLKPVTATDVDADNNSAEKQPSLPEPVDETTRFDALFPSGNQPVSVSSVTPAKPHGQKPGPSKGTAKLHKVAGPRQAGNKRKPRKQVQRKRHFVKKDF